MIGLGQIITRMKPNSGYYYGIGLPHTSEKFVAKRLPWKIAKKLKLYIFLVYPDKNTIRYSWKDLKEQQKTTIKTYKSVNKKPKTKRSA